MRLSPFDDLHEALLRGGIAPRHVKRYLRELSEHLADLTQAQREAGFDADDAAAKARAALGPDAELADAMLKQRDFRSLSARFPWAVFGIAPFLVLLLAAFVQIMLFVILGHFSGGLGPHNFSNPAQLMPLAAAMQVFGNFFLIPATAMLFVVIALRQRLPLSWPLLSSLLIVALSLHWDVAPWAVNPHGWGAAGLSYRAGDHAIRFGFTPIFLYAWWQALPAHGLALATQYALTLLPLAWLLRMRRNTDAAA